MKYFITFLALLAIFSATKTYYNEDETLREDKRVSFMHKLEVATRQNPALKKSVQTLENLIFNNPFLKPNNSNKMPNSVECEACKISMERVKKWATEEKKVNDVIEEIAQSICYNDWHIFNESTCSGLITEQTPHIINALWQHYLSPGFICPTLKLCKPEYEKIDLDEMVTEILKDKPQNEPLVPKQENTIKFLHLADVHTDFNYTAGNSITCPEGILCCRSNDGKPSDPSKAAGFWGTIARCDIPTRTFEKAIQFIKEYIIDSLDFTIWTGDNTSHNIWAQSFDQNIENTVQQTAYMKKEIPNWKMYPMYGNHESYPVNLYEFYEEQDQVKKFNDVFAEIWQDWLGEEAAQQLKEQHHWEKDVPGHNLRIMSLNTGSCDSNNFSLIQNPTDPGNYLQKFRQSLYQAEKDKVAVYVMHHIPSNGGCMNQWGKIYSAIIDRFSYTIRGIFTAHTHADELGIFYDQQGNPVAVDFIAPSLTTYSNRNPSFRVFEADAETYQILNYKQYRLDLDYWNQYTDPNTAITWDTAYDFLSEYNIPNMWDLKNMDVMREKVGNDLDTFNTYAKNFWSGVYTPKTEINKHFYCKMESYNELKAKCHDEDYIPNITELFAGPWFRKKPKTSEDNEQIELEEL